MVVCQFYLKDQCRFGQNCRNEHPVPKPTGFGGPGWSTNTTNAPSGNSNTIAFTIESIQRDFMPSDKPLWPLSSYGVAKGEPTFLTGLDMSPEELRSRAVDRIKRGRSQSYTDYEASLIQNANMAFSRVTSNAQGAFEAAFQLSKQASGNASNPNPNPAFGGSSAFGQPAATTTFGQSAFGQPKPFGTSGPSAFGQAATPAFGQSAFGSSTNKPAFGAPAFGQQGSAFGSSNTGGGFGTSTTGSAFGASTTGAFGGPSGFGNSTSTTGAPAAGTGGFSAFASKPAAFGQSTFGQSGFAALASAAGSGGTPAYAQPDPGGGFNSSTSQPFGASVAPQPFGGSAFGSSSNPAPQGGGFGAFAGNGASAFGASTGAPTNPFGQSTTAGGMANNAFSASSAANPASAFGQPQSQNPLDPQGAAKSAFSQPTFGQSAFGQAGQPSTPTPANPFGAPTSASANPFGPKSDTASSATVTPGSAFGPFGTNNSAAPSAFGGPPTSVFGSSTFGSSHPPPQATSGLQPSRPAPVDNIFESLAGPIVNNRPVNDPYASQLPPNYVNILPKEVIEAFASERFKLSDGIPTWIPPLEMR